MASLWDLINGYSQGGAPSEGSTQTLGQAARDVYQGLINPQAWQEVQQATKRTQKVIPSVLESLGRGSVAQVPGTLGDISALLRQLAPQTTQQILGNRIAPTTDEILGYVPRMTPNYQGSESHEMMGGLLSPALGYFAKAIPTQMKGMPIGLSIKNVSNYEGFMPHFKEHENLASVFEKNGLNVKETGSAHSNSRYVEIEDPISGEIITTRFSNHPQSGRAMTLHGPADLEVGEIFKNKSWTDVVNPILDRINKARKEYGDELLNLKTTQNHKEILSLLPDQYRGSHVAPNAQVYGGTLDDLGKIMPEDVYTSKGKKLYGINDPNIDNEWWKEVYLSKGKPDRLVEVHRAVPKGVKIINNGDWVTTSKTYAKNHGENALNGEYDIITKKVPAKTLSSEGYPYEFGYNE